jgi:hypothetical protein
MKASLAWVMVTAGLWGCGAQELPGGSHDAGRDVSRPVIDATERNLDDAGCPPEGKIACSPLWCDGAVPEPECIRGAWSCETLAFADPNLICPCGPVPSACSCDQASGVISCPIDAGTTVGRDGGQATRDGSASCPPLWVDGGHLSCGCGSDTDPPPTCAGGAWLCPAGSSGLQTCPPCANQPPPPPGCRCNPANGALTCTHDAGADAPS